MIPAPWSWTNRLLLLLVAVIWGFNFLFIREALTDATPLWLALLRAAIGAGSAAVLVAAVGGWGHLSGRRRAIALLLGLPNTAAFYALLFLGIQTVLPGVAAVLTYTFPFWVALLSPMVLGHRLTSRHWLAIGAGFTGIALISEVWSTAGGAISPLAGIEILGSAVAWAVGTVLFQRQYARSEMLEANLLQLVGGTIALGVLTMLFAPSPGPTFTPAMDVSLLWIGVLGTAVAYSIWFDLLGRTKAATLSAYVFLVPLVALVGSAIFFGERIAPVQLAGIALVLASIYGIGRAR